jgi:hypothetical protein
MRLEIRCSDGLADDGWKENYSHIHRRNSGEVYVKGLSAEGHFITPQLCSLVVDELTEGFGNGCYTLGYALFSTAENSQTISYQLPQEALCMEQKRCGKTQLSIHPQKDQYMDQQHNKTHHLIEI